MFKKILRVSLKVLMWILIGVFSIILLAVVALQFPQSQDFLTGKATDFLEKKTKTRVEVGGINIRFPKAILLKDIYVEDQKKDTLLYAHRIAVDIDLLGLLSNKLQVNNIQLEKITGHVERTLPDSAFNFDFIIDAFASNSAKPEEPADTTKGKMDIKVMGLELEDIYLTYKDQVSGMDANIKLGEFEVELNEFNLDKKEFIVDFIRLNNTTASLIQTKLPTSTDDPSSEPLDMNFGLGELDLESINLKYDNRVNKQNIDLRLGELNLIPNDIDLTNQKIDLDKLELNNTSITYIQDKSIIKDTLVHERIANEVNEELKKEAQQSGKPWSVTLNKLNMVANNLKFDDFNVPAQKEGMDFKHLLVQGLGMDLEDISYSGLDVAAQINQFVFREKSGFRINNFTAKVMMDSTSAKLTDLDLTTGKSHLANHLEIGFASLSSIGKDIGNLKVNANIEESFVSFEDILYFQPALTKNLPFSGNEKTVVKLDGKVNGSVDNLNIPSFKVATLQSTILQASGRIKGLPDINKSFFDMKVSKLASTAKDIKGFLPASMLPSTINLPAKINITADFKGYIKNFDANTVVKTSLGGIVAKVNMEAPPKGKETYQASVKVNNLELGKLLKQDSLLGAISLQANINGSGLSANEIVAKVNATIQKAVLKGYEYRDLKIDGKLIQKEFIGKINYSDSNLVFAFDGDLNFNNEAPKYKFTLNLPGANLKALNLTSDDLRIKTKLVTDIVGTNMNDLNGNVSITETLLIKNDVRYNINSFLFASINQKRKTEIKVESDIMDATFGGTINIGDLATALKQHINRYFSLQDPELTKPTEAQNFTFDVNIKNSDLLTEVLVPGLTKFTASEIKGNFDSRANNLTIKINMPEVAYSNISVKNLEFTTGSDANKMDYKLSIAKISQDSTQIRNIAFGGDIRDNAVNARFGISDDKAQEKFVLGGILKSLNKAFRFQFAQGQVILNYKDWKVNEDNYLEFGNKKFFANNVRLENNGQFLALNTINRNEKVPDFQVNFNNFNLDFISGIIESKQLFIGGAIDGNVVLEKFPGGGSFTSDLKINNFSYKEDTLGNITLLANNKTAGRYDVNLNISGKGNDVSLTGFYSASTVANALNFNLNINNLNLSSIESYTGGQATRMSGSISGDIKIAGSTKSPAVNGTIVFKEAGLNVTYLNSYVLIDNERIRIDNSGIHFPSFTIKDEKSNTATINGDVLTKDFKDIKLNLTVSTNDFRVLNTSSDDNELFYGTVLVDSRIRIRGDINNPIIDSRIKLEKGTNFTFAIPDKDPASATQEGVVYFVNMSKDVNPMFNKKASGDTVKTQFKGMNLTAAIDLDPDAVFNIVIDKERGDFLTIQGSTDDLLFAMDPSGKITLSGRYLINKGNYKLSFYNLVKRNFKIKQGSTLVWAGDPLDAKVDISAIYSVRTSSGALMGSTDQNSIYRQRLPYEVYLNMKGALMEPEIDFDIKLQGKYAARYTEIDSKLRLLNEEEAALNQQVFALLILNGFIAENGTTGGGTGFQEKARGSVSEVLSQQLSRLSDKYVKGVNLTVGVESYKDYEGGAGAKGRTQLNLGVSKEFFNNRVEVQVGSNIDLEGSDNQPDDNSEISNLAGDMSIRYKLTPDGRYKLEAFRENRYEQTAEGQIVVSGVSFIFTREYNRLSELFRKTKQEEEDEWAEEELKKDENAKDSSDEKNTKAQSNDNNVNKSGQ